MQKTPYDIIISRVITEKASVLASLKDSESNKCIRKFQNPKYVFFVNVKANKKEVAWALEKIYTEKKIKVKKVNIVTVHPKTKRVRGHLGRTIKKKKAIVTLDINDNLDDKA
ncbi:MAG: 50S ribosomal protein L23 [Candidatus Anoxychlamydiales bacterium]|nr:50S ribosomal protein L23 [Candidatus Anoxychlamydiales bacterium]